MHSHRMKVADIMTANPITVRPEAPLRTALEAMAAIECHHLPVISPQGHLIGIITARDCRLALRLPDTVREYWEHLQTVNQLLVRNVMSAAPIVAAPETPAEEAARLMMAYDVSCLPVMRDETLVGIVTISDIVIAFVGTLSRADVRHTTAELEAVPPL
ncbi:MAG: CBS domain-containing protein [Anaerolineae bacterium]|nr:CBS domain-containing protein [Anaerolineae bacterium]